MQYRKRAWAEISLDALSHNVQAIRRQLPPETTFCAVVKADAYGHGEEFICRKLYAMDVRFFAVSSYEEAVRVRRWCPDAEILILGHTSPECAPTLSELGILQAVVSEEYAAALAAYASKEHPVRCHIKLDTGMGRIGVRADADLTACVRQLLGICSQKGLCVEGLFTHFAVADETAQEHLDYTTMQETRLFAVQEALEAEGIHLQQVHCMNSAAICYHSQPKSTLARAGIILYGLHPNAALEVPLALEPVLSLRSRISYIKTVEAGTCISYGRTYTTEKPQKIATVTIGYADGYSRLLSNCGEVLVDGVRCPIVGRICMDQMMIAVDDVPNVQIGTAVTLIGSDGDDRITADDVAGMYGTIGYEVVCGISKRVPRIFTEHGEIIHEDSLV